MAIPRGQSLVEQDGGYEIVLVYGFVLQDAARCPDCPGRALIWPASALPAHLARHGVAEEKPRRNNKAAGRAGQVNRKQMSSTGVERKEGIRPL